ncbi:MAG: tetratricopeptide repeat protein [Terriglobales bacterium]
MKLLYSKFAVLFLLLGVTMIAAADPATVELLSRGRMNEAISALSNRGDAESLNLLSRAYYAMERWDDAVRWGERAVAERPQDAGYHLWLARAYGRKAGDSSPLAAAGLARKAKNEFERAVQLDPANVEARSDLSKYYVQAPAVMGGGLDKARDQAAQVSKYDAAEAHSILAQVAVKAKRYDEAENQFRSAIKEAHNPATYWLQLADYYRLRGRFDDAQKTVLTAVAQPSRGAENYYDAGNELYLSGRDFPDAAQYLQRYLDSGGLVEDAPAFRAHYLLGQIYEKMGRGADATSEYEASLALASGFDRARKALDRQ